MDTDQQPDQQYLQKLDTIEFQPIFILGLHRTGTSILYKVLTATGCFNPVTAYHIMRYDHLLTNHIEHREEEEKNKLTESFKQKGVEDRKLDQLKISADFEEEYGFLLSQHTNKMFLNPKGVPLFKEMCKKIKFIAENNKPILLKNPFDFGNFLYIKELFPHAKFIFIHRHPLNTISSNLNAFRSVFKEKNPYTAALSNIYEWLYSNPVMLPFLRFSYCTVPMLGVFFITRYCTPLLKYYLKNIEELSTNDYISTSYEQFCQSPQKTIEDILEKLSLRMVHTIDASTYINPRNAVIDSTVIKMKHFIYSSMKKYFNRLNYSIR